MGLTITITETDKLVEMLPPGYADLTKAKRRGWWERVGDVATRRLKTRFSDEGRDKRGKKFLRRLDPRADGASGPALSPHGDASRTVRLMRYRATATGIEIYWTGDWGTILGYHAAGIPSRRGLRVRDAGGFLQSEQVKIYQEAMARFAPTLAASKPKPDPKTPPKPKPPASPAPAATAAPIVRVQPPPPVVPVAAAPRVQPPARVSTPAPVARVATPPPPKPAPKPKPPVIPKPVVITHLVQPEPATLPPPPPPPKKYPRSSRNGIPVEGDITVAYDRETAQAFAKITGRKDFDPAIAAKLAGALPGTKAEIGTSLSGTLMITVSGKGIIANRNVTPFGYIKNVDVILDKSARGNKTLARMLYDQAVAAHEVGIPQIRAEGAGTDGNNGYYTLPRIGFDAETPHGKLSDLMSTPEGREFWRTNGAGKNTDVSFDTNPNSPSMRTLREYLGIKDGQTQANAG